MKLFTLRLKNFRQFYGEVPPIQFAHGEKNVTIIIGTNGSGKTSILNAFTWLLYDAHTPAFQHPEEIVNKRAIFETKIGDVVHATVELSFSHNDYQYVIRRTAIAERNNTNRGYHDRQSKPSVLQQCGPNGEWKSRDDVADCIGRILPKDLHSFFFFDGERMERIVQAGKKDRDAISDATKKLIGVEILDRAVRHLEYSRKVLEREYANIGDLRTQGLLKDKIQLEEDVENLLKRYEVLNQNLEGYRNQQNQIQSCLRELQEVQGIQRQRDELTEKEDVLKNSIKYATNELQSLISNQAYAVYLEAPSQSFKEIIDELRRRGELPSGIKRQFVEDLLKQKQCICDRTLAKDDPARKAVEVWMEKAGLADVEESAIRMGGEIRGIESRVPEFWKKLENVQKQKLEAREALAKTEKQLEDISNQLKRSPKEEVAGLERNLEEASNRFSDSGKELGRIELQLEEKKAEIKKIDEKIAQHRVNEKKQEIAQRRVKTAKEAIEVLVQYGENLASVFREDLEHRVRDLFGSISFKPYVPEISHEYHIRLTERTTGFTLPVGASTGENQILSLSFIGSIIDLCGEYAAKRQSLPGPDSSQFPIVMDSPFGSLGRLYREQIGYHLPKLANQVVILVSETQWGGEVEKALGDQIGNIYVLSCNSTKEKLKIQIISLGGESYRLVRKSTNDYEYSNILKVTHG